MGQMKEVDEKVNKTIVAIKVIFWVLVGTFVVIAAVMASAASISTFREYVSMGPFLIIAGGAFLLSGIALIILAVKGKVAGIFKKFLLLTGASAVGIFVSSILHNVIYGLFIQLFGAGFWDRIGMGDEPFFFIMAIFVCPIGFLVGMVSCIVLFTKKRRIA